MESCSRKLKEIEFKIKNAKELKEKELKVRVVRKQVKATRMQQCELRCWALK